MAPIREHTSIHAALVVRPERFLPPTSPRMPASQMERPRWQMQLTVCASAAVSEGSPFSPISLPLFWIILPPTSSQARRRPGQCSSPSSRPLRLSYVSGCCFKHSESPRIYPARGEERIQIRHPNPPDSGDGRHSASSTEYSQSVPRLSSPAVPPSPLAIPAKQLW
jgi:hypothetical protein